MSLSILARGERLRERLLSDVADLRITGFQSAVRTLRSAHCDRQPHSGGISARAEMSVSSLRRESTAASWPLMFFVLNNQLVLLSQVP